MRPRFTFSKEIYKRRSFALFEYSKSCLRLVLIGRILGPKTWNRILCNDKYNLKVRFNVQKNKLNTYHVTTHLKYFWRRRKWKKEEENPFCLRKFRTTAFIFYSYLTLHFLWKKDRCNSLWTTWNNGVSNTTM